MASSAGATGEHRKKDAAAGEDEWHAEIQRLMHDEGYSKSGAKKLLKQQARERKRQHRKEEKRAQKQQLKNSFEFSEQRRREAAAVSRARREHRMHEHRRELASAQAALHSDFPLLLDFRYWWLMTPKERKSMAQQLCIVYSSNRRAATPESPQYAFSLHLTALDASARSEVEQSVPLHNWHVHTSDSTFVGHIAHHPLLLHKTPVVLSADSANELSDLRCDEAYVVGCFVDRNRRKNTTESSAAGEGVKTARLPIKKHASLKTDTILTVNQVVDILLMYRRTQSWQQAVDYAVPARKRTDVGQASTNASETPSEMMSLGSGDAGHKQCVHAQRHASCEAEVNAEIPKHEHSHEGSAATTAHAGDHGRAAKAQKVGEIECESDGEQGKEEG